MTGVERPAFIRESQRYRPDIDVLRAIAVGSVLLFHAGFTALPGGFAGVDVFFVISGYLISGHLLDEQARSGRVSIFGFYNRRFRRIAPVLIAVLLTTSVVATGLLLPVPLVRYSDSLAATMVFASNLLFWRETGYFAAQNGTLPLLHTWSLSLEEQFYLVVPLLIAGLARRRAVLVVVVLGAFAVSLGLSAWQSALRPALAFYLLPTRTWELLLGTILALRLAPVERLASRVPPDVLAVPGFAMIVAGLLMVDEATPFPGVAALLPCGGTALVIASGRQALARISVALAVRPILFLGLISYSLYLWHWPVIVFWRYLRPGDLPPAESVLVIILSLLLAAASWRLIETPTRSPRFSTKRLLRMVGAGAAVLVLLIAAIRVTDGFPQRFSARTLQFAGGAADRPPLPQLCEGKIPGCGLGIAGAPQVLLIGDSFAGALAPALDLVLRERKLQGRLYHRNSCPPLYSLRPARGSTLDRDACLSRNVAGLQSVAEDARIREVVLVSSDFQVREAPHLLAGTIRLFRSSGKRVLILYGLPRSEDDRDVPIGLATAAAFGTTPPRLIRGPGAMPRFAERFGADAAVRFVDLAPALCDEDMCRLSIAGHPVYSDAGHVSMYAARTTFAAYLARALPFTAKD
jgi:peptidoglycan/LPS O-acetylase OafA/YrhL